jgi:hypothetical protein
MCRIAAQTAAMTVFIDVDQEGATVGAIKRADGVERSGHCHFIISEEYRAAPGRIKIKNDGTNPISMGAL